MATETELARRAADPGDRGRARRAATGEPTRHPPVVRRHVLRRRRPRGLPVAAAADDHDRAQDAEADQRRSNAPLWPATPGTFEFEGEELDVYIVPMPDGSTRELALLEPGRRRASSSTRPSRTPAITWERLVANPRAAVGVRAPLGELRRGVEIIDFPRLIFNTVARHDRRSARSCRACSWRTASRASVSEGETSSS